MRIGPHGKIWIGIIGNGLLGLWSASKSIIDWIGRSTVIDDAQNAVSLFESGLLWLFATPWWVPAGLAGVLTALLIIWIRPDQQAISAAPRKASKTSFEPTAGAIVKSSDVVPTQERHLIVDSVHVEGHRTRDATDLWFALSVRNRSQSNLRIEAGGWQFALFEQKGRSNEKQSVYCPSPIQHNAGPTEIRLPRVRLYECPSIINAALDVEIQFAVGKRPFQFIARVHYTGEVSKIPQEPTDHIRRRVEGWSVSYKVKSQ